MAGVTNKGKYRIFEALWRGGGTFYLALVTSATPPTADTNTLGEMTEITAGNGYTAGGYSLTGNSTDFDTLTEDDGSDLVSVQLKDIVFTASGGDIPASGNGAKYAVLLGSNATVSAREVLAYWPLASATTVASGTTYTLADLQINGTE